MNSDSVFSRRTVEGSSAADAPVAVIQNLRVSYRDSRHAMVPAVKGIDMTLRSGVRYGLVGESGSGKSTVVRSLVGLVRPPATMDADILRVAGCDLLTLDRRRRRALRGAVVAYVPQSPFGALHPVLSVGEQFHQYLRAHRATDGWADSCAKAAASLASLGIHEPIRVLEGHAGALSGGMAQRVIIAMSRMLSPRLVIADEPTTALDVTVQRQVLDLLASDDVDNRPALLLTTHDLGVVSNYCDEVFVMYAGQLVESGPVESVFRSPQHTYTASLLDAAPRARFFAQGVAA